jgi:hypothetical protein
MSIRNRIMAASIAFWNILTDPGTESTKQTYEARLDLYRQAFAYYENKMFSRRNGADWTAYLAQRELYKHTRLIFNPIPNIIDFYLDNLWKPADNKLYPGLSTPLIESTDEKISKAVEQLDGWGMWLSEKNKIIKYAATAGSCLVEGIEDFDREKVFHNIVWAGMVKDVELNASGDVQAYTVEYEVYDHELKRTYQFKKIVNKDTFSYFRDDKPFIPKGKMAEVEPNPYGFVFAVWLKHGDNGGDHGTGAFTNFNKVDEVNSLASHLHDNIHKEIESGKIIGVEDTATLKPLTGASQNDDGTLNITDPRLDRLLLIAKGSVSVSDLSGLLKLSEAHPYLKELILSIGADYPELEYKQILKESAQVSGIALERLLTPAQNRLDGAQAYYNQQLVKFRQMGIAVAGFRANGGGWMNRTNQQAVFAPFGLKSYERGQLDFQLERSVLITLNEKENEELLQLKADRAATLKDGVDKKEFLLIAGYSEEKADEILARKAKEIEEMPPPTIAPLNVRQIGDGVN